MTAVALAFCAVLALAGAMALILASRLRPSARAYLGLAALLYGALAIADATAILWPGAWSAAFGNAVTLLVCALAPATLTLALFAGFEHPPSQAAASIVLVFSLFAGVAASATGIALLSFVPLILGVLAMAAFAARHWRISKIEALYAILSALCLVGASSGVMTAGVRGQTATALFSAAAILGITLALARRSRAAVAEKRGARGFASAIRVQR